MAAGLLLAATISTPVSADPPSVVQQWNAHAANALMNTAAGSPPGAGYGPTVAVLHMAMVQGAVYDAVNSIVGRHEPYLGGLPAAPATASQRAAVVTAASTVLLALPLPSATLGWLTTERDTAIAAIAATEDATAVEDGIEAGAAAAGAMLLARANDGRFPANPFQFSEGTEAGQWRRTATVPPFTDPAAWVARVTPFLMNSTDQFRTDGPLALTSAEYAAEYNEVKSLGSASSTTRTAEQEALALFYTPSPVEIWNRTFRGIAGAQGLATADEARLFAMLNMAGADGLIACWDDKAFWSFWRPMTAIRQGDADGNPATEGDPTWTPLRPNPPYPDHPSGYNCLTSSVMNTAIDFFGTKKMTFTVASTPAANAPTRTYHRFGDVVKDTIDARIYLGIHFRTPDVQGAIIGQKVAHWLDQHYFRPVD